MRLLLNNIGGILIMLLLLAFLIYLPNIINSVTNRGLGDGRLGEVSQKIRSFLSTHGSQVQSRDARGRSRTGQEQDCNNTKRDESFPDFYIVPRSLSESKDDKEEPFDGFYAGGKH